MASLYDQIRKPWAAWEMTMEGHDPTGVANGVQLLADGDMEAAGVGSWTVGSGASLSKEVGTRTGGAGTQILRVSLSADNYGAARQNILTIGARYRVTGWGKGDGGEGSPSSRHGAITIWAGTTSTDWQYFDETFVASSATFEVTALGDAAGTDFAEFDDVSVELMPPRVLDMSGNGRHLTLGDGVGGSQPTKLTQKRGYNKPSGSTAYLVRQNEAWSSNRLTVEILGNLYKSDSGVFFGFGNGNAEVFEMFHGAAAADQRFYVGSLASANNAARYATGRIQFPVSHLVGRYDGTNTELFWNGVMVSQAITPLPPNSGTYDIYVFRQSNGSGDLEGCNAYLCRIWDVALTDVQIRELSRRAKQELTRI